MSEQESDAREQLLDWNSAEEVPMTVDGFILIVRGVAPVPMKVKVRPMPIGIVPEDYRGVEVLGMPSEVGPQVETPWTAEAETKEFGGARKGFVLKGATMTQYFPPKDA